MSISNNPADEVLPYLDTSCRQRLEWLQNEIDDLLSRELVIIRHGERLSSLRISNDEHTFLACQFLEETRKYVSRLKAVDHELHRPIRGVAPTGVFGFPTKKFLGLRDCAARCLIPEGEAVVEGFELFLKAAARHRGILAPGGDLTDGDIRELAMLTQPGDPQPAEAASDSPTPTKPKRSTERGDGRAKLIAALTKHHQYADGSCLNLKPIGNNALARLAGVAKRTASAFFDKEFRGHGKYKAACSDAGRLVAALKLLNGEFAPHLLCGNKPPEKPDRDGDGDDE